MDMRQILQGGPMLLSALFLCFGLSLLALTLPIRFFSEMKEWSRAKGEERIG
jgi:hypothetical protein